MLMHYDPTNGSPKPYPSQADQYRTYHDAVAWLFNPWTGANRDPRDIGTDVFGMLIVPPAEDIADTKVHVEPEYDDVSIKPKKVRK